MNFDREAAGLEPIHKITIPLEEYKELLMIKGKYEELKSTSIIPTPSYPNPHITWDFKTTEPTCVDVGENTTLKEMVEKWEREHER